MRQSMMSPQCCHRNKAQIIQKKKGKRPWWDSNPQSPAPEAGALSIRPQGQSSHLGVIHLILFTAKKILMSQFYHFSHHKRFSFAHNSDWEKRQDNGKCDLKQLFLILIALPPYQVSLLQQAIQFYVQVEVC